jgi:hypothetical protein
MLFTRSYGSCGARDWPGVRGRTVAVRFQFGVVWPNLKPFKNREISKIYKCYKKRNFEYIEQRDRIRHNPMQIT